MSVFSDAPDICSSVGLTQNGCHRSRREDQPNRGGDTNRYASVTLSGDLAGEPIPPNG